MTYLGKGLLLSRPRGFFLGLPLLWAGLSGVVPQGGSAPGSGGVTHVKVEGTLDVGTQALLSRALREAGERGDRLLLELDTPGGEIELMWNLAGALLDASDDGIPTVCWVHDRALSAGALLAMSCERLYMRAHGSIGSALPVTVGPSGLMPSSQDEQVREKLSSALRSEFRGIAERRGRPGLLAEAMVDPDVEVVEVRIDGEVRLISSIEYEDLRQRGDEVRFERTVCARGDLFNATGREAVELGLADGLAQSLEEVIGKMGVGAVTPSEIQRTRSEDLAGLLYSLTPLLLIAAFVFAFLELKVPGFGIPGVVSIVCIVTLLFGRYLVGLADVPHIVLIAIGVSLIATELFLMPGTIWVGLSGAAFCLGGLVWSLAGRSTGFEYGLDRKILFDESFRMLLSGFVALLLMWAFSRVLPKTPGLNKLVLAPSKRGIPSHADREREGLPDVGSRGMARTRLRPAGKVVLDGHEGAEFEARSDGREIAIGERIRVVEAMQDGRLVVAPDPTPPDPTDPTQGKEKSA